jgi:hypothetical protein
MVARGIFDRIGLGGIFLPWKLVDLRAIADCD